MRPPICAVCHKRFTNEGGLVRFKLTPEEIEYNKRFDQKGFTGHPKGLEWFCEIHIEKAKAFSDLSLSEALKKFLD